MEINDYINGVLVGSPINNDDAEIEINFQPGENDVKLSSFSFEWGEAEAKILTDYLNDGVSGGRGITNGVPHIRKILESGKTLQVLDGFIDLSTAQWDRDLVTADTKERAGLEWVTEVADGVDFQTLYNEGFLTKSNKVFMPYVISSVPNYKDIMITSLTLASISIWIKQSITEIAANTAEAGSIIDALGGVIQLIAAIIYAIFLLISIIKLILDLVDLIISRIKYAACMSLNDQINAACDYLGLNYSSPILQDTEWIKLHIIPEAYAPPVTQSDDRIKGYFVGNEIDQTGFYKGTFGDLLRKVTGMFNLRIVSNAAGLQLLSALKPLSPASVTIPDYYIPQFTTNADSLVSNIILRFETDMVDLNTVDDYKGTIVQSQLLHKKIPNSVRNLQLLKGFNQTSFGFARAIRKNDLTSVERTVDALMNVIGPLIGALIKVTNGVIKIINGIKKALGKLKKALKVVGIKIKIELDPVKELKDPNLDELLDNRVGMMLLERDQIGIAKIALLDINSNDKKTKISVDNNAKVNARYLFDKYHKNKSFAPGPESAQRFIYNIPKVEMNLGNILHIMTEGNVRFKNKIMQVVSCSWNSGTRLANFVIEERKNYTTFLKEETTEPDGT